MRVPPQFHQRADDLRAVADLLNDYLRDADVDVPGSQAAAEHEAESQWADDNIPDPVFHMQVRAHHGLISAIDHLNGIAACIDAENVTLATMSLLRPTLVAAGTSYWVLDPDIALRERLRRGYNLELDSVREQLNSIDYETQRGPWEHVAQTRFRYLRWAQDHGYTKQEKKERFGERRYWLADGDQTSGPPSEMQLAGDVLGALGPLQIGRQAYRFASAFIHAQPHAFSVLLPADMQYDPQVPNVVPLGISLEHLTTWLMSVTMAVHTSAARCAHYFGWDMTLWVQTVHPIMKRWMDDVTP